MEPLLTLVIAVVAVIALLGFDVAAMKWGVDTRPGMMDDHQH